MNHYSPKIRMLAAALVSTALLMAVPVTLHAGAGSADDPLITYSFIMGDFRAALKQELYQELYAAVKQDVLDAAANGLLDLPAAQPENSPSTPSAPAVSDEYADYAVVHLQSGQTLLAEEVCEMILRSGQAVAVVQSQDNIRAGVGLSDLTAGVEVTNGKAVERNHLLLVARADGRGIAVTSSEAYVMVRGAYKIV